MTSRHVTSRHVTSRHVTSRHVTQQVAALSGQYRLLLAHNPDITMCATVGHMCAMRLLDLGPISARSLGRYHSAKLQPPSPAFVTACKHRCRAIRKLAAVATPVEAMSTLWRGVRGELPRKFWMADEQGIVAAVETAFMSTSSAS